MHAINDRDLDIIFSNPIDWEIFRNKKILVTASTGRLGRYMVAALHRADREYNLHMRIYAHARNEEKLRSLFSEEIESCRSSAGQGIIPIISDITEQFSLDEIDYIFHTAGMAAPSDFTYGPVDTLKSHLLGTINVLDLAVRCSSERVIYFSTVEVYGENPDIEEYNETDYGMFRHDIARACYPESKRMCETMLASYAAQYGIEYLGVRMSHTLGEGISLDDGRSFAEFMNHALHGENIILHSDGSAIRAFTYTADVIGGVLLATTRGEVNTYYNIVNTDNMISIGELAEMIAGFDENHQCKVIYEEQIEPSLHFLPYKLSTVKTARIRSLGWIPRVNLSDTLRYTYEYIKR
ncbi:Nucleoside-diphosphate-sugar epimerase [Lachnospiraceae bacterium XBB2008]|nr:Nucleoside-diphosphate-sugar epimerase [Lachnospiraceae bacterium XBB2008]